LGTPREVVLFSCNSENVVPFVSGNFWKFKPNLHRLESARDQVIVSNATLYCIIITSPSVVWLVVFGQSVDSVRLTINAFLLSILLQIFKISKLFTEIVMNFQVLRNFYNNFIATNMIHHVIYIAIHECTTALILCTIK